MYYVANQPYWINGDHDDELTRDQTNRILPHGILGEHHKFVAKNSIPPAGGGLDSISSIFKMADAWV